MACARLWEDAQSSISVHLRSRPGNHFLDGAWGLRQEGLQW